MPGSAVGFLIEANVASPYVAASVAAFPLLRMEKFEFVGFGRRASLETATNQVCDVCTCLRHPPQVT